MKCMLFIIYSVKKTFFLIFVLNFLYEIIMRRCEVFPSKRTIFIGQTILSGLAIGPRHHV